MKLSHKREKKIGYTKNRKLGNYKKKKKM